MPSSGAAPGIEHAEAAFAFLHALGFHASGRDEYGPPGVFRSGWELRFGSPTVSMRVLYSDWQLEIQFEHGGDRVEYFALDRDAYGRRSGFHGNMFPPDKLNRVLDRVVVDIHAHYQLLLSGDPAAWSQATRVLAAPREKRRLP